MPLERREAPLTRDQVVKELLQLARKVVPAIELVLLDRGFYSVAVIRYLPWTTSTKPARRLLLVGLALLLRNLWALLHYSVIRQPDRQDELTLPDMLAWIAEGIKDTLGFRTEIELQHRFVL